jgi:hypothetical protein
LVHHYENESQRIREIEQGAKREAVDAIQDIDEI